jgi:tetratricopeptide (TPR) repeat protein
MRAGWLRGSLLVVLGATGAAADDFVKVIPPGNEALVADVLGARPLPADCALGDVSIDRTQVSASWTCAGKPAHLTLVHPGDRQAEGAAAKTAQFALVASPGTPSALVDEMARRLKAREGEWRWVSAEAAGLGRPGDAPTAPVAAGEGFTAEQSERFLDGVKRYRAGDMRGALDTFVQLARTTPHEGVLGMVVASLASTAPTPEDVERLGRDADARPDDALAQFLAGVAAHYCGHQRGRTREEKAAYYARALHFLERTRPDFDFEPRVYVYLAVSHFRLGHQDDAERLVEAAVPLAKNDPDVFYCRAEIFQRKDPARAVADIRTYLQMTDTLAQQGVPRNAAKHQRVESMLAALEASQHGAPLADDLFDPLATQPAQAPGAPPAHHAFSTPGSFAGWALGAAVLASLAWWFASRRGRQG